MRKGFLGCLWRSTVWLPFKHSKHSRLRPKIGPKQNRFCNTNIERPQSSLWFLDSLTFLSSVSLTDLAPALTQSMFPTNMCWQPTFLKAKESARRSQGAHLRGSSRKRSSANTGNSVSAAPKHTIHWKRRPTFQHTRNTQIW